MDSDRDNGHQRGKSLPRTASNQHPHSNGAHHATDMKLWRCPNCGQSYFGAAAPDMCDFCSDFTTWQLIGETPDTPPDETPPAPTTHAARHATQELNIQLRLIPDEDAGEDEHVDENL